MSGLIIITITSVISGTIGYIFGRFVTRREPQLSERDKREYLAIRAAIVETGRYEQPPPYK